MGNRARTCLFRNARLAASPGGSTGVLAEEPSRVTRRIQLNGDHFHDECGVFGFFGNTEAAKLTYLGLYALQHRGQESAGIASTDGENAFVYKAMGEVQEIFTPEVIAKLTGA